MPRKKLGRKKQVNFRLDQKTFQELKKLAKYKKKTRTDLLIDLIRHQAWVELHP